MKKRALSRHWLTFLYRLPVIGRPLQRRALNRLLAASDYGYLD